MTDPNPSLESSPTKQDPERLVLRGRPRPVVRFRRGLIVGTAAAVSVALAALSWVALEPPSFRRVADAGEGELAGEPAPDALANVPEGYGAVPRLGPPLPGDLGRPILDHRRSVVDAAPEPVGEAGERASSDRERLAEARRSARAAPLLVAIDSNRGTSGTVAIEPPRPGPAAGGEAAAETPPPSERRFSDFASSAGTLNPHELRFQPSPWTLAAGTLIPASLITGLNSDLPGLVLAQVTANVRDSATGRTVLIPQGARLIGKYDNTIAYGQSRVLLVWTRIILPDGSSIEIDNMPATDSSGFAGVADGVDAHSWQLLKGIGLSTLLGVGTELSIGGSESDLVRAIRQSAQQNAADAGGRITGRTLDIRPTITVRPGWPVRAVVNKDLVLKPWRG